MKALIPCHDHFRSKYQYFDDFSSAVFNHFPLEDFSQTNGNRLVGAPRAHFRQKLKSTNSPNFSFKVSKSCVCTCTWPQNNRKSHKGFASGDEMGRKFFARVSGSNLGAARVLVRVVSGRGMHTTTQDAGNWKWLMAVLHLQRQQPRDLVWSWWSWVSTFWLL